MKIFLCTAILMSSLSSYGQQIGFHSNGFDVKFEKVDTLFYTEYSIDYSDLKASTIYTESPLSFMKILSHVGTTTTDSTELEAIDKALPKNSKLYTTTYFRYSDGTLEAPTSYLYFKPYDSENFLRIFSDLGKVIKHPSLQGSYYLQLNTAKYGNGEAIFKLCDSLYDNKLASIVEPVFTRLIKPSSDPDLPVS